MGALSDKDYEQMIQILAPMADKIYTVAPDKKLFQAGSYVIV